MEDGSNKGSNKKKPNRNPAFGRRLKQRREFCGLAQSQLAEKIGSDKNTIQRYEAGSLPKGDYLLILSETLGCSTDWLLKGAPGPSHSNEYLDTPCPPSSVGDPVPQYGADVIEIEHISLVRGFKDKRRALNINRELVELERLDKDAFQRIEAYIKGTVDTLRILKERNPDRRGGSDRRQAGNPEQTPNGTNRRSGKDRRKSAGGEGM